MVTNYIKKNEDVYVFDLDVHGNKVPQKEIFRGSICRYPGCKIPVATGHYVCKIHKPWFKTIRKHDTHELEYTVRR